jgi:hypothetical protein
MKLSTIFASLILVFSIGNNVLAETQVYTEYDEAAAEVTCAEPMTAENKYPEKHQQTETQEYYERLAAEM